MNIDYKQYNSMYANDNYEIVNVKPFHYVASGHRKVYSYQQRFCGMLIVTHSSIICLSSLSKRT